MKKYLYEDLYVTEDKHWWHVSKRKICLDFIEKYSNAKAPQILDIGCGTGKNIEALSRLGTVWGIDNSKVAVDYCVNKRKLRKIYLADAQITNFHNGKFDIVTMLDVLEHLDDKITIKEIRRILKPKGLLVLTVPASQRLWSQWDVALHHKRRYSKKSLFDILTLQGFKVIKISYMYSFLIIPVLIIRSIKSIFAQKHYSSDFQITIWGSNLLMSQISKFERQIIKRFNIPFGTSLICIAQKK